MAEFASGPLYIRTMDHLPKGRVIDGHRHNFAHVTLVIRGRVKVTKRGEIVKTTGEQIMDGEGKPLLMVLGIREFGPGVPILIAAECHHEIEVLEDDTAVWCQFTHRDPVTGGVVQEYNGWERAYG